MPSAHAGLIASEGAAPTGGDGGGMAVGARGAVIAVVVALPAAGPAACMETDVRNPGAVAT